MGKRLLVGLLKGLVVGAGLGAALQLGLGWGDTSGLLGYLFAMGVGGTAGLVAGRPLWLSEAWIEAILKAVAGIAVGALLHWLSSYIAFGLFFDLPGAASGTPWTAQPLLYAPLIGGIFGAVIELDNTEKKSSGKDPSKSKGPKVRAAAADLDEFFVEPPKKKNRKARG